MSTWGVKEPISGMAKSWRDIDSNLSAKVDIITAPYGRGIQWEGTEIYAYKDRYENIIEALEKNIRHFPDKVAYVFQQDNIRLTWQEVGEKADQMAFSLRNKWGFKKGNRLALLMGGSPEFIISYFATLKLGGIVVPVNLGLSAEGIVKQINKVRAKVLVIAPKISEKLNNNNNQLNGVKAIFETDNVKIIEQSIPFESLFTIEGDIKNVSETIDEWDVCTISFTSGTTGHPKGTMAMHTNALACAETIKDLLKGLTSEDVNICMPPLYHGTAINANILPALIAGATSVIMEGFNPLSAIKIIDAEKVTFLAAAPIMIAFIMDHPEFSHFDHSTLKKFAFGGHAASAMFINRLIKEFSPIAAVNAGSVSESTASGFGLPTEDAIRKITSCGLATACTEIALFDEKGNMVTEPNVVGEVAYKGQQTNAGYWEEEEMTNKTFRKDGYVLSGDWAKIDEEGYLWLLDRKKDMIVRGGQNVYCIGVENQLYQNDKILRAAVVGVPDHLFAERVKAVIVLKPGVECSQDEIREYCSKHLASYEVPEYIVFTNELPTNPAGKTLKPNLIDLWDKQDEKDIISNFENYMRSMSTRLLARELLKVEGKFLTPQQGLEHLLNKTNIGNKIENIVREHGVVGLLKPDEARFNGFKDDCQNLA